MRFHNLENLDLTDWNYTVRCCTTQEYGMFLYIRATYFCCCSELLSCCRCSCSAAACCCCHVPDGQVCCWLIESDPSVFLLLVQTRFIIDVLVPLGSDVSYLRPRFADTLGNYGHARSQGEHHPAATKPPLYHI